MVLMMIGLALFFSAHLLALAPRIQGRLRDRLGVGAYRGLYSLVSAAGLVLIVVGYRAATTEVVYAAPSWGLALSHPLMLIAVIFVAGANMKSNLRRYVPHPMSIGILIWALVHLVNNGSVQDLVLFGAFAAYALIDIFAIGSGKPRPQPQPLKKDLILVAAGVVAYGAIFLIHNQLIYIGGPA